MGKLIGQLPVLPVKNLVFTIVYYKDILGFDNEWFWEDTDGGISRDDIHLVFTENADYVELINTKEKRFELMWFVQGIEEMYEEFVLKDIEFELPLTEQPWGLKEFAFRDINGYYIRVAERADEED